MSPRPWRTRDLPRALLVIAPHPDDEVLGCGRLMRRVVQSGGRVAVIWMTDGGASHGELGPGERAALVAQRQDEALAGLAALGVEPVAAQFLGRRDGGLAAEDADALVALIQAFCEDHEIDTIAVTDGEDGHADHRAAFALVSRLTGCAVFTYPVSARYDGEVYSPPADTRLIPFQRGDRKRAALERHRSQRASEGVRYPMSETTIERFCSEAEMFIPVRGAGR